MFRGIRASLRASQEAPHHGRPTVPSSGPFSFSGSSLWNHPHSAWLAGGPWELEARILHEDRAGAGPRLGLCRLAITLEPAIKCKVFVRLNKECPGAGAMAQQLKALFARLEKPGCIPNRSWSLTTIGNSSSRRSSGLF